MISDRRPDEEGIKTLSSRAMRSSSLFQTADLMKKGLRLDPQIFFCGGHHFRPQT